VPAAASCLASASGTSSRVTLSGAAKYQVAWWRGARSRWPVPGGPEDATDPPAAVAR
jgi:hypothetical protein